VFFFFWSMNSYRFPMIATSARTQSHDSLRTAPDVSTFHTRSRRAVVILVALVALAVIGMLSGMLVRSVITHYRQSDLLARNVQAMWLVQSGMERAVARLAHDPRYTGEQWDLSADALNGPWPGTVVIHVEGVPTNADARQIDVTATYPTTMKSRITRHRQCICRVSQVGRRETEKTSNSSAGETP